MKFFRQRNEREGMKREKKIDKLLHNIQILNKPEKKERMYDFRDDILFPFHKIKIR